MGSFLTDLRYAARMLWKARGTTIIAIASLAVGIGANVVVFSIVNSFLFRPRPVTAPDELVEIYTGDRATPYQSTSYPSYLDLREANEVFTGLAAYGISQFRVGAANEVQAVWGETVSGNYFDVLGVRPQSGRTFLPEEDSVPSRNAVAVIGHALWQRLFDGRADVLGSTITINSHPFTIVGIAPPRFAGMMRGLSSEIWVPAMMLPAIDPQGQRNLTSRGNSWVIMVGRLEPGTTLEQAQARFAVLTQAMQAAHPEEWRRVWNGVMRERIASVLPERATRVHPGMGTAAYALAALLFVIVNLVLLIACMNLASMLFARAVTRRGEIAVRLALGAARGRIVRQLLTENLLLSLVAGAAGFALAVWVLRLLVALIPPLPEGIRVAVDLGLDWRVVAYTIAFTTVTGLLFGLAPALHSSRAALSTVLKDDSATVSGRHRTSRVRRALVVGQVAFSLLLLIGAGLVVRSLENLRPTRLGFATENVLVAPLSLDEATYGRTGGRRFYQDVSERVARLPGVTAVTLAEGIPGGFLGRTRRGIEIEGYVARPNESREVDAAIVGPRYFTNMKVPVVQGRDFAESDREGSPCAAIVNEPFVRRYLGATASPLGRRLTRGQVSCEIVGVVRDDGWQSLETEVRPFFALALQQWDNDAMTLLVNTVGDPRDLVAAVRQTIRDVDASVPVTDVQTLADSFSGALYPFRLLAAIMAACGVTALLLATIGIYGIVSYSVEQRRREVGIRMALGAVQGDILRLVVGQGMVLVAYGLGTGLLLSFALTRVLTSLPLNTELLFGVSAIDSATFAGVTAILGLVALVACCVPALRAARLDPMVALRTS